MTLQHNRQITISVGNSRKELNWKRQARSVETLYSRLETPQRGTETQAEYFKLPKSKQDELKDVGGFVGGTLRGPRRKADNVADRCVITLDFDNIPAFGTDDILSTLDKAGYGYCVYSTRKHRPEAPRLRVVIVTDKDMNPDEYDAVSRRLAADIGIAMADPTTFEVHRLMYWPSCSADGAYVFTKKRIACGLGTAPSKALRAFDPDEAADEAEPEKTAETTEADAAADDDPFAPLEA